MNTVNNKNWGKVTTYNNVNEAWSCWVTMFNDACNKHAPIKQKRVKGFLPEWVTSDFLQLSKDRDYCYAKAHRTNNVQDWAKAKALRNKANNLNKSLKSEFFQKEIKNNIKDSNKLWKSIEKVIPNKHTSIGNIKTNDKGFTTSDTDAANKFNDYFTSIGLKLASKFQTDHDDNDNVTNYNIVNPGMSDASVNSSPSVNNNHNQFVFCEISSSYVYKQICKMSNSKSPGIDCICPKLLKIAAPLICSSLAHICNISLCTSVFPNDWKAAKVTPIYKSGDKSNVDNYRPISVLPIVSKMIERSVHDQLYSHLMSNNILNDCQSGFRKHHSTTTTLLDVQDYILINIDNGCITAAVFLDLKKAFDTLS